MNREYIISFILNHDSKAKKKNLEKLSDEALLMIKIQLVFEVLNKGVQQIKS